MANRSIDYVAKDFDSIVDALITFATVNFGPGTEANRQWTSFNADDFSRTWLELVAYVGDLIFFYLDVQATQSNLQTATIRSAVLNIAKQFGFVVSTASSASGLATFTVNGPGTIPVGFRISATNGSEFFVSSSSPSPGSTATQVILSVLQGVQREETFTALGVQNEEIVLGFEPLVVDSTNIVTSLRSPIVKVNSVQFTLVNSFINSLPTDNHFRLVTDADGQTVVRFGDGVFGKQLDPNDVIEIDYRTGGGTIGNIPAATLTSLVDSLSFVVSVTNANAFSGGADEPSNDKLRELIPADLRTLDRAVAVDDYGDLLEVNFNEVLKSAAEENTTDAGVDVNVYVVPSGTSITPITTNTALFNSLTSFLDKRKAVTTTFRILDAFGIDIDTEITAFLTEGISRDEARLNLEAAMSDFLNLQTGDIDETGTKFGQEILLNDLYAIIDAVEGIQRFEITKFNYIPRVVESSAPGANYLLSRVRVLPKSDTAREWLAAPNENAGTPVLNSYSVFSKLPGNVTILSEDSLTDENLNLAVVEGTATGVNTEGSQNVLFDTAQTFLEDQFVGGSSSITISNVSGDTWDFSGSSFSPRVGDRIQQGTNFSRVASLVDSDTFVLSTGKPSALSDGPASIIRDEFLLVDGSGNIWTISDNDAHSLQLSAFAINNTVVSDVSGGDYAIVRSVIGNNILFRDLIFAGIDFNTKDTLFRIGSSFNLVGTIGDIFYISEKQVNEGNFGVPTTIDNFDPSTPTAGLGRVHFAGNPDLSSVTVGVDSNFVLIDSNLRIFEIVAVDNAQKTVDILHEEGASSAPAASTAGSPASVVERYYSDNNEVSFVFGLSNQTVGVGFQAIGSIQTIHGAEISDGEFFTLDDGVNPAVTFEFDSGGGVSGSNEAVAFTAGDDADTIKLAIINAVNTSSAPLAISGSDLGSGVKATGSITTIDPGDILEGETFTLNDGINPAVIFEFDTDASVSGSNVAVDISAAADSDDVKDAIITAVTGATIDITASDGGTGIVNLENDFEGFLGNQTITENVANLSFEVSGMSGGVSPVVLLQNNNFGVSGNNAIINGVASAGFVPSGMSGGLDDGSPPTPVIPGPGKSVNDLGIDADGNIVDQFQFNTSGYLDDIVNLRKSEIPEFLSTNLKLDLRGGVS